MSTTSLLKDSSFQLPYEARDSSSVFDPGMREQNSPTTCDFSAYYADLQKSCHAHVSEQHHIDEHQNDTVYTASSWISKMMPSNDLHFTARRSQHDRMLIAVWERAQNTGESVRRGKACVENFKSRQSKLKFINDRCASRLGRLDEYNLVK